MSDGHQTCLSLASYPFVWLSQTVFPFSLLDGFPTLAQRLCPYVTHRTLHPNARNRDTSELRQLTLLLRTVIKLSLFLKKATGCFDWWLSAVFSKFNVIVSNHSSIFINEDEFSPFNLEILCLSKWRRWKTDKPWQRVANANDGLEFCWSLSCPETLDRVGASLLLCLHILHEAWTTWYLTAYKARWRMTLPAGQIMPHFSED